ncbi:MAG: flippase [Candidatus Geothermincolia bacterium]
MPPGAMGNRIEQARDKLRLIRKDRLTRNFLSGTSLHIAAQAAQLLTVIYLARMLGPRHYGLFAMTTAIMAYFMLGMTFGLPTIGIREVARDATTRLRIYKDIARLRFGLALIVYSLMLLVTFSVPGLKDLRPLLPIYGLMLFVIAMLPDWTFIGMEKMAWPALAACAGTSISLVLLYLLVKGADDLPLAMGIVLGGSIIGASLLIGRLLWMSRGLPALPPRRPVPLFRKAFPFIFSALSSQVYGNADLILLGFIKGREAAGIYAAAYKIINLMIILIALVSQATYPAMARIFKAEPDRAGEFPGKVTIAMLAFFLPVALGGSVLAPSITSFFFGADYAASAAPLAILLWYILLSAVSISFSNALLAVDADRPYITAITVGALLDVGLIAFLVPRWGVTGAAVSMIGAEVFIVAYLAASARARLGLRIVSARLMLPVVASSGMMTLAILYLKTRFSVPAVIAAAGSIYAASLLGLFLLASLTPRAPVGPSQGGT